MKVRSVVLAFVSAVCFAGLAANQASTFAASPTPAIRLVQDGFDALQQGDATRAIPLFTQSIESRDLRPDALANAFYNRGLAYQRLGQGSNAADDYTAALNLDAMPTQLRARLLYNRGLSQQQLGHATLAIEDYTSALLIDGSFSYAYLARANALRESGQYLFSISDYERATKYQHPDMEQVYYGEGLTYEALNRLADAKRFYQKAMTLKPDFAAASSRLTALSAVAENDELTADPVLSSTVVASNPAAHTEVVARLVPTAVEPPANLMAQEPEVVMPAAAPAVETAAVEQIATPTKVVLASVPKIPVPKHIVKSVQADPIETAATDPAPTAAPDAQEAAAAAAGTITSSWAVQISSAASEDGAWASFKLMQKSHKVLVGQKPVVVQADLGSKGTVYRVRFQGFDAQGSPQSACAKLKAGGVTCFVAKTEG